MKRIISTLLLSTLFLASCSEYDDIYYYDMYIAIEVVDSQGNDLLNETSGLINYGETKMKLGGEYYYLNSPNRKFTFRHIQNGFNSFLKIGYWCYDRTDLDIILDWGADIEKDRIVFSYDSHLNGFESPAHDFRYPHNITINEKELAFNSETGHFIYVKDIK